MAQLEIALGTAAVRDLEDRRHRRAADRDDRVPARRQLVQHAAHFAAAAAGRIGSVSQATGPPDRLALITRRRASRWADAAAAVVFDSVRYT